VAAHVDLGPLLGEDDQGIGTLDGDVSGEGRSRGKQAGGEESEMFLHMRAGDFVSEVWMGAA